MALLPPASFQTNLIQLGRVDCVQPARLSIDGDGVAVLDGHVVCRAGLYQESSDQRGHGDDDNRPGDHLSPSRP
jgi:hypothetical protein